MFCAKVAHTLTTATGKETLFQLKIRYTFRHDSGSGSAKLKTTEDLSLIFGMERLPLPTTHDKWSRTDRVHRQDDIEMKSKRWWERQCAGNQNQIHHLSPSCFRAYHVARIANKLINFLHEIEERSRIGHTRPDQTRADQTGMRYAALCYLRFSTLSQITTFSAMPLFAALPVRPAPVRHLYSVRISIHDDDVIKWYLAICFRFSFSEFGTVNPRNVDIDAAVAQ